MLPQQGGKKGSKMDAPPARGRRGAVIDDSEGSSSDDSSSSEDNESSEDADMGFEGDSNRKSGGSGSEQGADDDEQKQEGKEGRCPGKVERILSRDAETGKFLVKLEGGSFCPCITSMHLI